MLNKARFYFTQGGMPGSSRLRDCASLKRVTLSHAEQGKLVAAICAAPAVILQEWGLLEGRKVTELSSSSISKVRFFFMHFLNMILHFCFPSFVSLVCKRKGIAH